MPPPSPRQRRKWNAAMVAWTSWSTTPASSSTRWRWVPPGSRSSCGAPPSKPTCNAADPGYVKTDMNAGDGLLSVPEGARASVRLALLDDDGPTGGYFHLDGALPW